MNLQRAHRLWTLVPAVLLAACTTAPSVDKIATNPALPALPAMKTFATAHPDQPERSNRDLARDFIDLSLMMESGAPLPYITRFEGPITLRVNGLKPPTLQRDLDKLLVRLRREAGLTISQVPADQPASITIDVISRRDLQRTVPHAACFVAPNVSTWEEYKRNRNRRLTDWRTLNRREHVTIFMPGDVSPQDIRDCLHEEIAQAVGPLNDLFRMPDSVFNDDNFHTVLTGTDMLILRAYYSPQLRSGMGKAQVAALIPAILRRINPAGEALPSRNVPPSPQAWRNTMAQALAPQTRTRRREQAIASAIEQAERWNDNRLGFALAMQGRLLAPEDPARSYESFVNAYRQFSVRHETRLHAAHVAAHLAIYALAAGHPEQTLILVDSNLTIVERAENASLLSTLLFAKAEALDAMGRVDRARAIRQEAQGWARYGIGSDAKVRKHEEEIAHIAEHAHCDDASCKTENNS